MSTQVPLGSFTVASRLRRATSGRRALQTTASANPPLIFITLESSQWIVFNSPPTVSVTLPSGVPVNGENFYLSVFENGSTSSGGPSAFPQPVITTPGGVSNPPGFPASNVDGWVPYVGPVSGQGGSAAFADTAGTFSLLPNQPVYLAVFQSGIAQLSVNLSAPLVMGTASTPSLDVTALDQLGGAVQGVLPEAMTFTTTETAGRASLGGTSITNLSQTVPVTYDGDADQFSVTATLGGLTGTLDVTTLLPQELFLTTPSPYANQLGPMVIGSDGNVWSTIGAVTPTNAATTVIAKVTASGTLTQIADSNAAHLLTPDIVEGGDGNVWVPYNDFTDGAGLDQVTPSGTLTSFTLGASLSGQILGAAVAPDGSVWTVVSAFSSSGSVDDVERTTSTGTTTQIGTLANAPSNLLFGPDKNLWFAFQNGVGKMTPSGSVSTYTLPVAATYVGPGGLAFVAGSDGNFWVPYPAGALTLLKFSTSGTVVSNAPLAYAPFGTPSTQGPVVGALAVDANGTMYVGDTREGSVIRIAPSGTVAEYPTYSSSFGRYYFAPLELAVDSSNRLYIADEAWPATGANASAGLSVAAPTLW